MKLKVISLILMLILILKLDAQVTIKTWCEKYEDQYDNTFYPIINGEITYTFKDSSSLQFTYWSNTDTYIYPYVNIVLNWRKWVVSVNPLTPDIYNYTIQITFYETLSFLPRRKRLVDRLP